MKSGKPLGSTDRETIVQISEDMNLKAASFDEMRRGGDRPRRWRDARVVVRVKGKEDGAPVSGLRIYYVPRALAGRREEIQHAPAPDAVDPAAPRGELSGVGWDGERPETALPPGPGRRAPAGRRTGDGRRSAGPAGWGSAFIGILRDTPTHQEAPKGRQQTPPCRQG